MDARFLYVSLIVFCPFHHPLISKKLAINSPLTNQQVGSAKGDMLFWRYFNTLHESKNFKLGNDALLNTTEQNLCNNEYCVPRLMADL